MSLILSIADAGLCSEDAKGRQEDGQTKEGTQERCP